MVSGAIPGNSQLGVLVLPIPQKAAREVLEAWYFHQTWAEDGPRGPVFHQGVVGVVLEAWYYTRVGQEWS